MPSERNWSQRQLFVVLLVSAAATLVLHHWGVCWLLFEPEAGLCVDDGRVVWWGCFL